MNKHILEKLQIVTAFVPISMEAGANNGDWVSLKNFGRCAIVFFKGAGTAGDDPVITVKQAQDVSGTNPKALNFTRIDAKVGVQTGLGQFATVTQAAGGTYTDAVSAEAQGMFVIDVQADDLDVDNGYDCLQFSIPDVGTNAQVGAALYLLHEPHYAASPMPSAIVD